MEKVTFNGTDYPVRIIRADGAPIHISTLSFYDAIHPGTWEDENEGFASDEAKRLYDDIFFFVDDGEIHLPFEKLKQSLEETNPEYVYEP